MAQRQTTPLSFSEKLIAMGVIPEFMIRKAIRGFAWEKIMAESHNDNIVLQREKKMKFVHELRQMDIAIQTRDANQQHYEVPTEFFKLVLGPLMKYSCCYFGYDGRRGQKPTTTNLAEAEIAMNELYAKRALLSDGMRVLDLGCGWGTS